MATRNDNGTPRLQVPATAPEADHSHQKHQKYRKKVRTIPDQRNAPQHKELKSCLKQDADKQDVPASARSQSRRSNIDDSISNDGLVESENLLKEDAAREHRGKVKFKLNSVMNSSNGTLLTHENHSRLNLNQDGIIYQENLISSGSEGQLDRENINKTVSKNQSHIQIASKLIYSQEHIDEASSAQTNQDYYPPKNQVGIFLEKLDGQGLDTNDIYGAGASKDTSLFRNQVQHTLSNQTAGTPYQEILIATENGQFPPSDLSFDTGQQLRTNTKSESNGGEINPSLGAWNTQIDDDLQIKKANSKDKPAMDVTIQLIKRGVSESEPAQKQPSEPVNSRKLRKMEPNEYEQAKFAQTFKLAKEEQNVIKEEESANENKEDEDSLDANLNFAPDSIEPIRRLREGDIDFIDDTNIVRIYDEHNRDYESILDQSREGSLLHQGSSAAEGKDEKESDDQDQEDEEENSDALEDAQGSQHSQKKVSKKLIEDFTLSDKNSLTKLNDLLDRRYLRRNQLMQLFHYIDGVYQYKVLNNIDDVRKLVPDFPRTDMVSIFLSHFKVFQDLPESCRKQIVGALQPLRYKLQDRILKIRDEGHSITGSKDKLAASEPGMYMITNGEIIVLKTEKMYERFMQNEHKYVKDREFKSRINDNVQFGSVAKIGWTITSYLLRTERFRSIIDERIEMNKKENLIKNFQGDNTATMTLGKGEVFGDFSLLKNRAFNPIYAIAMHPDTQILYLSRAQLRHILTVDPVNFKVIRDKIPGIKANSLLIQQKICRCFEEVDFCPNQVITRQGQSPLFTYLIKEGTAIINHTADSSEFKSLLMSQREKGPSDSANSGLQINVPLVEISGSEWIGEEFILWDKKINRSVNIEPGEHEQTVIARTYIKALKISCLDFRKKLPKEYIADLKVVTTDKQDFLAKRAAAVQEAYENVGKVETACRQIYLEQSTAIRSLHPCIPQKMVESLSFGDGKKRKRHHSRCRDMIRIGEITLMDDGEFVTAPSKGRGHVTKRFRRTDTKKDECFEIKIEEQKKRQSKTESLHDKNKKVSQVHREIEELEQVKWNAQYAQEKLARAKRYLQAGPDKKSSQSPSRQDKDSLRGSSRNETPKTTNKQPIPLNRSNKKSPTAGSEITIPILSKVNSLNQSQLINFKDTQTSQQQTSQQFDMTTLQKQSARDNCHKSGVDKSESPSPINKKNTTFVKTSSVKFDVRVEDKPYQTQLAGEGQNEFKVRQGSSQESKSSKKLSDNMFKTQQKDKFYQVAKLRDTVTRQKQKSRYRSEKESIPTTSINQTQSSDVQQSNKINLSNRKTKRSDVIQQKKSLGPMNNDSWLQRESADETSINDRGSSQQPYEDVSQFDAWPKPKEQVAAVRTGMNKRTSTNIKSSRDYSKQTFNTEETVIAAKAKQEETVHDYKSAFSKNKKDSSKDLTPINLIIMNKTGQKNFIDNYDLPPLGANGDSQQEQQFVQFNNTQINIRDQQKEEQRQQKQIQLDKQEASYEADSYWKNADTLRQQQLQKQQIQSLEQAPPNQSNDNTVPNNDAQQDVDNYNYLKNRVDPRKHSQIGSLQSHFGEVSIKTKTNNEQQSSQILPKIRNLSISEKTQNQVPSASNFNPVYDSLNSVGDQKFYTWNSNLYPQYNEEPGGRPQINGHANKNASQSVSYQQMTQQEYQLLALNLQQYEEALRYLEGSFNKNKGDRHAQMKNATASQINKMKRLIRQTQQSNGYDEDYWPQMQNNKFAPRFSKVYKKNYSRFVSQGYNFDQYDVKTSAKQFTSRLDKIASKARRTFSFSRALNDNSAFPDMKEALTKPNPTRKLQILEDTRGSSVDKLAKLDNKYNSKQDQLENGGQFTPNQTLSNSVTFDNNKKSNFTAETYRSRNPLRHGAHESPSVRVGHQLSTRRYRIHPASPSDDFSNPKRPVKIETQDNPVFDKRPFQMQPTSPRSDTVTSTISKVSHSVLSNYNQQQFRIVANQKPKNSGAMYVDPGALEMQKKFNKNRSKNNTLFRNSGQLSVDSTSEPADLIQLGSPRSAQKAASQCAERRSDKHEAQPINDKNASIKRADNGKDYGKFTEKLKMIRQRREELFNAMGSTKAVNR